MWGRHLPVIAVALCLAAPAAADPATFCEGKYAGAAQVIDAALRKYDTLYSGGNHNHGRDHVGATIDVYRLMRGYPDLNLRGEFEPPTYWNDDVWDRQDQFWLGQDLTADVVWSRARWAWRADAPADADAKSRFWAQWGADVITSAGPTPDWWMRASKDDPDLTPTQVWVAEEARKSPELAWLQAVLAGSNAPWANVPTNSLGPNHARIDAAHERIAEDALRRYEAGEGVEWLVAAMINALPSNTWSRMEPVVRKLEASVLACRASVAEYTALEASRTAFERLHPVTHHPDGEWLESSPAQVKRIVAVQRIFLNMHLVMSNNMFRNREERIASIAFEEVDDELWQEGFNLLQLYTASTVEQLPVSTQMKMSRAYNLLSADDLAALSKREGANPWLLRVAFARHVALGANAKAIAMLPALKANSPEQAAMIDSIWPGREPEAVRLSLIVVSYPEMSSLLKFDGPGGVHEAPLVLNARYVDKRRNLPEEYRTGGTLQRDFEVAAMADLNAYWTLRGMAIDWIDRMDRGDSRIEANTVPDLLPSRPGPRVPFALLIAWDELVRLTGEQRLMHTVAATLIPWAENGRGGEKAAEGLARLVEICRYNSCGEMGGAPAQKRAFEVLKSRYPNSSAAGRTKVWWPSPEDG